MYILLVRDGISIKTYKAKEAAELTKQFPTAKLVFRAIDGTPCSVHYDPELNKYIFEAPGFDTK